MFLRVFVSREQSCDIRGAFERLKSRPSIGDIRTRFRWRVWITAAIVLIIFFVCHFDKKNLT